MPDQLSTLYSDLLEGSYDCVDRSARLVKIFTRYQGASRNGGLKALSGAGFL